MRLSEAIRTGASPDPLDAAVLAIGQPPGAPEDDGYCRRRIRALHYTFPHIGASVRQWPALAMKLESLRMLPRIQPFQPRYRQEIHKSLWQVCVDLHDLGYSNDRIADLLGCHGL